MKTLFSAITVALVLLYAPAIYASTDDRFSLPVLEGLKGNLRGFMFTYQGEWLSTARQVA